MRRSLTLLLTAGLLPVVALGGTFGGLTLRSQRRALEQQADLDANFAAALLGVKLESMMRSVAMVAQSPAFDGRIEEERLKTLSGRILADQREWVAISIASPDGVRLLDMPKPIGGREHGKVVEVDSFRAAVRRKRALVGLVAKGPHGTSAFAVRAPVVRDGRVLYVVSAVVRESELRRLLLFRPLPDGWSTAAIDPKGHAIAAVSTGSAVADGAVIERWRPVPDTDWRVRVTAPAEAFDAPLRNAILILGAAALICLILILVLARELVRELSHVREREASRLEGQRMEALGRLTGGIAHDLNNLLTPVIGSLDLIGRRATDERIRRYVEAASASAERAKTLAARLLAFSKRQPLAPDSVDLPLLVEGMADLISHSLPPGMTAETIAAGPSVCHAHADARQLELAILNLVINARDAMPSGGTLRIEIDTPSPDQVRGLPLGTYVGVTVADTGSGMDEATLRRAVEPFFTTKDGNKGTGLGLSMVHGFAAQSGGALRLNSVPGEGTRATIILPCTEQAADTRARQKPDTTLPPATILLVDDDEAVRLSTAEILRDAGQTVHEASSTDEALAILDEGRLIDALVTDFVMPGRSGGELIRLALQERPGLPVLLVTGYVSALEDLPSGTATLIKPFGRTDLIDALAEVLSRGRKS